MVGGGRGGVVTSIARNSIMKKLPPSAKPGTRLGKVVAKVDGERVGESPLVARTGYEKASLGERVWYTVEGLFE